MLWSSIVFLEESQECGEPAFCFCCGSVRSDVREVGTESNACGAGRSAQRPRRDRGKAGHARERGARTRNLRWGGDSVAGGSECPSTVDP